MEKRKIRKKDYGSAKRMSYAGSEPKLEMPNLIEMQKESYEWFLAEGLKEVFEDVSPISDHSGKLALEFVDFRLDIEPKFSVEECKERDTTYASAMRVKTRLHNRETNVVEEKEIFMGDFPLMTDTGTFIINGAERVIVSQLVRAPGIYYSMDYDKVGKQLISTTVIPNRGAWIEYETDSNDIFSVRVDRTRKVPVSMLMRSLGLGSNTDILNVFGDDPKILATLEKDNTTTYEEGLVELYKKVRPGEPPTVDSAKQLIESMFFDARRYDLAKVGRYKFNKKLHFKNRIVGFTLAEDVVDGLGEIIAEKGTKVTEDLAITIQNSGVKYVELEREGGTFRALSNLMVDANSILANFDLDAKTLGVKENVYFPELERIVEEFGDDTEALAKAVKDNIRSLVPKHITHEDIFASMNYVINIDYESGEIDDIDHLGNRRIRAVGELLQNQYRIGFARLERVIRERMTTMNQQETVSASTLINIRPVTAVIKEFFGSSQLSQFMDQTNPLSELANKRRLSALGPGGLSRDRAGFEVRDVHSSHFGRMCPIESPEGPNIGLINSLACYARINEYGFIEAPYIVVDHSGDEPVVTEEVVYLTADEEEKFIIGQANEPIDENGHFEHSKIVGRYKEEFIEVDKEKISLLDVSPKQMISIVTALIPFLENNESTRALMGSNMQRQAVPLLKSESPIVGTGMESKVAVDSGVTVVAKNDGEVIKVSANEIVVLEESGRRNIYKLTKFIRSNQGTCINQRPIVNKGDKVTKGQVLADGPSTSNGELALGKNPLIGFMTWEGYNYEDAILLSEKLVQDDVYTSVHIEEYEIESRDTKLGPEEITRDIPNVGEDTLKNLDSKGIIRIGAEVKPGDILVGKVAPKGETELTAEERLLRAIFGEKAREVRDTSLRLPHGESGIIVDVKIFNRENSDELSPGVNELVRCYIASKRKISVGDKMAGRHGNKGVISRILPVEDMPYLPNGRPLDIVLNPLGVPSRMNIGQVLEVHLGLAAKALGWKVETPVFDGAHEIDIMDTLNLANDYVNKEWDEFKNIWEDVLEPEVFADLEANKDHREEWKGVPMNHTGKILLRDGRSGEEFDNPVTVGYMHYLKLHHLVDDKIHARSTGPYSLVTQQPLGGKAQFGGQRFGEMEVWALEAYGASYTLQEILTVKSDDIVGRVKTYEAIVKGENIPEPGIPESFKVLLKELQALALDVRILKGENLEEIEIKESSSGAEDINAVYREEMESVGGHDDGFVKREESNNAERTMIIEGADEEFVADIIDDDDVDFEPEEADFDDDFDLDLDVLDYDDEL